MCERLDRLITQTIGLLSAQVQRTVHTHHRRLQLGIKQGKGESWQEANPMRQDSVFIMPVSSHNGSGMKTPLQGSIWTFTCNLKVIAPSDGLLLTQLCQPERQLLGLKPPKTPEVFGAMIHSITSFSVKLQKSYLHTPGKVPVHSHLNLSTYKPSRCCFVALPHP